MTTYQLVWGQENQEQDDWLVLRPDQRAPWNDDEHLWSQNQPAHSGNSTWLMQREPMWHSLQKTGQFTKLKTPGEINHQLP